MNGYRFYLILFILGSCITLYLDHLSSNYGNSYVFNSLNKNFGYSISFNGGSFLVMGGDVQIVREGSPLMLSKKDTFLIKEVIGFKVKTSSLFILINTIDNSEKVIEINELDEFNFVKKYRIRDRKINSEWTFLTDSILQKVLLSWKKIFWGLMPLLGILLLVTLIKKGKSGTPPQD